MKHQDLGHKNGMSDLTNANLLEIANNPKIRLSPKELFEISTGLSKVPTDEDKKEKRASLRAVEKQRLITNKTEEDVNLEFPLAYTMPK